MSRKLTFDRHMRSMRTNKPRNFYILACCSLYFFYTICVNLPSNTLRYLKVIHQDLEFVHITKTGGTTIERVGCENGYKWGSMHYFPYFGCERPDVDSAWNAPQVQLYTRVSPWHTPPKLLKKLVEDDENPFMGAESKKLFTIVRNPYTRFVSEYYCPFAGYRGPFNKTSPAVMNDWIQKKIVDLQNHRNQYLIKVEQAENPDDVPLDIRPHQKHFLNQIDYVYDDDGSKVIDHVLHYENMEEEFNELMSRYNFGLTLPKKDEMDTYGTHGPKLTYKDLDMKSIYKINQWAGADFVAFGYKIITEFEMEDENMPYDHDVRLLENYDPSFRSGLCSEFVWDKPEAGNCTRVDE